MRPIWAITTPAQPQIKVVKLKTYKLKTVLQINDKTINILISLTLVSSLDLTWSHKT